LAAGDRQGTVRRGRIQRGQADHTAQVGRRVAGVHRPDGCAALRAALPTTNADERAALVALLEALVANGYPARRAEIRQLTMTRPRSGQVMPEVRLEWVDDHALFLRQSYWTSRGAQLTGFEYAPGGRFALPKDATLIEEDRPGQGWGDPDTVRRFVQLLAARGPVSWDATAVDRLRD